MQLAIKYKQGQALACHAFYPSFNIATYSATAEPLGLMGTILSIETAKGHKTKNGVSKQWMFILAAATPCSTVPCYI